MAAKSRLQGWRSAPIALSICGLFVATAHSQTTTYTYDALGRVTEAVQSPSGRKVVYRYDDAGNRTQVSNGVTYAEITPTGFSTSTTLSGSTGLTTTNGMKDGTFDARSSIHVTQTETSAWIRADFGTNKNVDHIDVAPAKDTAWAIGIQNLNTAIVEYSQNGTTWTPAATVTGAVVGSYASIRLGGVLARYVRLRRPSPGKLAAGDLRFFSSDDTSNVPPVAVNDTAIANNGAYVDIDVLANDSDQENLPLSVSAFTQPAPGAGSVTQNGVLLRYTPPNSSYAGNTSFAYTAADNQGSTATASVAVTVFATPNTPPMAADDAVSTPAYMRVTFDPRSNDSDPNSNPITITGVGSPSHGSASVNNGTSITYKPTTAYVGSDAVVYTISDGRGGTSSANVNLTVTTGNPAMIAVMEPQTYGSQVTITGPRFNIPSNSNTNVYVNEPLTSGKYYWEVVHECGALFTGVATSTTTAYSWGGYSAGQNSGVYTVSGNTWGPGAGSMGASTPNTVYGFAYDAATGQLKIYKNNVLGATLATGAGTKYPHASMQSGVSMSGQTCSDTSGQGKFKFGAGVTTYAPPSGFQHLSDHNSE